MILFQHISPEDLEKSDSGKWPAYILFTATVGVLLMLNWLGVFTELWGVNTGVWLALIGGWRIFYHSVSALFEKRVTAEMAIAVAVVAALAIGEYFAAAEAVFIMLIGEGLEEYATRRTRSAIQKLIDLAPKTAIVKIPNANGHEEREVKITEVSTGDIVIVRPGERLPVDGVIVAGASSINEAPITGESLPADKAVGDSVFAGSVNAAGALGNTDLSALVSIRPEDVKVQDVMRQVTELSRARAMESVYKLKVLETKRLTIGVEMPDQALGRVAAENPTEYLTGDQNLINVRMAVQYAVKDPAAFLFRSQDVTQLIAKSVESAFAETIAAESVDSLLTTGKIAAQNATLIAAREILDAYESGVFIGSINIENVTPPIEVADAFRESVSARADRDRIVNEAQGYANDAAAKAAGEAEKLVTDAASFRQQRINEAEGDAARFAKLLAESRKAKGVTERRLYLETMEEVLPRVKKVVIDSSGPKSLMDLGIIRPNP